MPYQPSEKNRKEDSQNQSAQAKAAAAKIQLSGGTSWQEFEDRLLRVTQELGSRAWPRISRGVNSLPPGRVAHLLESCTPRQRNILWSLINPELEAEVASLLSSEVRQSLLSKMSRQELQEIAVYMDANELVEVFSELPGLVAQDVLKNMDKGDLQRVSSVMKWPGGTAGHLMTPDIPALQLLTPIHLARRYIGDNKGRLEGLDSLPVVDQASRYCGSIGLADLIAGEATATVESLINTELDTVQASAPEDDVFALLEGSTWGSLPVVDEEGLLLGVVRRDTGVEQALRHADELARSQTGVDEDTFTPLWTSVRRRAFWLGINLVTAFVAAGVIGVFQDTLDKVVALAVLMPIVTSMGGIAATQTLAITVRGLALRQLRPSNLSWLISREFFIALLCGAALTLPVGLLVIYWFDDSLLAGILATAVLLNLIGGALIGVLTPLLLVRIRIDPAVSGSVIVTTLTDVAGFGMFLGFGTWFYA